MSIVLVLAALATVTPANLAEDPNFIGTRVRSDGETLYCVRHAEKPTIFTPREECNTLARWSRVIEQRGSVSTPRAFDAARLYDARFAIQTRNSAQASRPLR